jgi:hypothetical protein
MMEGIEIKEITRDSTNEANLKLLEMTDKCRISFKKQINFNIFLEQSGSGEAEQIVEMKSDDGEATCVLHYLISFNANSGFADSGTPLHTKHI